MKILWSPINCLVVAQRPACLVAVLLLLNLALSPAARAQQSPQLPPPTISDSTIEEAKALAGVDSSIVVVKSQARGPTDVSGNVQPAHASIASETDAQGVTTWTITVYVPTVRAAFKPKGASNERLGGSLGGILVHELGHKCIEENGGVDDPAPYSCSHIAIRVGTCAWICEKVSVLKSQRDQETDQVKKDKLTAQIKGLCECYLDNQRFMNTKEGAQAAKDCLCPPPAHFTPPGPCPTVQNPHFPSGGGGCADDGTSGGNGTGFPGYQVIDDCGACNGV